MADDASAGDGERDLWDRVLTTDTEEAFREFVIDQLDVRSDESVLSVGCGPGFETAALAQQITEEGSVIGVDLNEEVVATARDRCSGLPQVSFKRGDITALPVADESYDLAIAKQVLSEISDIEAALTELHRVLKRDGRLAVTAGDRRTHVKHTPTERMQRADDTYRSELAEQQLGTRLVRMLPEVGFSVEDVIPYTKIHSEIDDQIERGIDVQKRILNATETFDASEIDAWEQELRDLDRTDQFLSCGTTFLYIAHRTG